MEQSSVKIDRLFETSWEVCNKVGGIYTVLSTKAQTLRNIYKDNVIFIGPDVWTEESPSPTFVESPLLLRPWRQNAVLPYGLTVRVGRWDVPGKPIAILVKFDSMYAYKDELYGEMWRRFGVDSLHAYGDYDEGCCFAMAAAAVIESIYDYYKLAGKRVLAHFDEWTTGMGLLYTKWKMPRVATVFTTHATCIGRSICGNGKPLYTYLKGYDGDQMARELNMESKHSLEKAAANNADCFTTVSDVTARECEQLLQRTPLVTPNGFEADFVPCDDRFAECRESARRRLLEVASALTGHRFDDSTFIMATSGRFEYRNKGIDLYLDAVARMGQLYAGDRDILAYVLVPAWSREPREDLIRALGNEEYSGLPDGVITHTLNNPNEDQIINRIHGLDFGVNKDAKVHVIYVPCYLNGVDGIVGKSYYDSLIGLDATVFPSYYEPWGYTPLESVAFGVPTVTTSLSGFGQWVLSTFANNFESCGVSVIGRDDVNYDQAKDEIAEAVLTLVNVDRKMNSKIRKSAIQTADKAAWSYFMTYYVEAFKIAFASMENRN